MRRIAFALVLLVASAWAAPSQAQWWGGGWGKPCFGACRPWMEGGGWRGARRFVVLGDPPRPIWDGPDAFGPPRFRAGGWSWGQMLWRREMRRRRFEAWRRWAEADRQAAAADRPRLRRWTRWRRPLPVIAAATRPEQPQAAPSPQARVERRGTSRAESAVAMTPTGALHLARPVVRAAVPSRVLAAAAMIRRPAASPFRPAPAVIRDPEPPARPVTRPAAEPVAPHFRLRPVGLRSQPASTPASQPPSAQPEPPPASPAPAAPVDVPVAPLD